MSIPLAHKKVALPVTDGFEEVELTSPRRALADAGAQTAIVSPNSDTVRGWQHTRWGDEFEVDTAVDAANPNDYDALVLPGGVMNPDELRRHPHVQSFVRKFFEEHKPVAAICHGPWTLIDAGVIGGRRMTSYHTIQMDLKNAGASWVDEDVVVDSGLITSRSPDDLDAFNQALIEKVAEGRQNGKSTAHASS